MKDIFIGTLFQHLIYQMALTMQMPIHYIVYILNQNVPFRIRYYQEQNKQNKQNWK